MRAEDRIRLLHMTEAAEAALSFVAGRQRGDLDSDQMLQFAVVRAVEVMGEAANKVSEEICASPCGNSMESHCGHAKPIGACLL